MSAIVGTKVWLIEKYARFLPVQTPTNELNGGKSVDKGDKGQWKVYEVY